MRDRFVEVAIDAAGAAGGRTYTYHVPERLADLAPGEAVLVDFGRRQALGVVLGGAPDPADLVTRPVRERVRSDGPLLPPLQLALAREIAAHYLAPPALVVRAMLPPGLFERLELRAKAPPTDRGERTGRSADRPAGPPVDEQERAAAIEGDSAAAASEGLDDALGHRLLEEVAAAGPGGIRVADLRAGRSRAETIRSLRQLEGRGALELAWVLTAPGSGPRYERHVGLTPAGLAAASALARGERPGGRPLGARQVALLAELAAAAQSGGASRPAAASGARGDDGVAAARLAEEMAGEEERATEPPAADLARRFGRAAVVGLVGRGLAALTTVEVERRPLRDRPVGPRGTLPVDASMTPRQVAALDAIAAACRAHEARAYLLDGVTGAGKTAVYARAIAAALDLGRDALVLVPEVALAVPLVDRLRVDLGIEVALLHGGLAEGERADEWRRIRAGEAHVVVGTRSAVLAPLADPGIVIVDEEHEASYKSDRTPRIQARDVALALGRLAGAPVVLGSATPDVATAGLARMGMVERIALGDRPAGRLPDVEVVDLRLELAAGNRGLLSASLVRALARLDTGAGDRAILLINRRGAASVVVCRDCGYVQSCPDCQRPLVYHAAAAALRCHHCGAAAPLARRCPSCGSARIRYLGGGTERLEQEVVARFPSLRVGRLDRDVAVRRGAAVRVLDAFRDGELDVLVGTSLVAKGLDVPEVTLVGVVSADIALNLPDARAAERTYQLLAQAVGRAGRGERPGRALIQSYVPDHPAIQAVARHDAGAFYEAELRDRAAFGFPPFGRLVKLTVADDDRAVAEEEARRMAGLLRGRSTAAGERPSSASAGERPSFASADDPIARPAGGPIAWPFGGSGADAADGPPGDVEVLGPVPAFVARRAGRWRFHVILRGDRPLRALGGDPGPPWSVDVDPESLL